MSKLWITLAEDDIRRRFPAYGIDVKNYISVIKAIPKNKPSKFFITLDLGE